MTTAPRRAGRLAAIAVLMVVAASCGDDDTSAPDTSPAAASEPNALVTTPIGPQESAATTPGFRYGSGPCAPDDVTEPVRDFDDAPQECLEPGRSHTATITTSEGDITLALDIEHTPGTVNNFVTLARYGYYDDTPIFRSDPSIDLFQAGGETNTSSPGYTIPDEGNGYTYPTGVIAMANTGEPDSAGAQWFIVTGPQAAYLAQYGTYVVFGHITEGLDVAQAITALGQPGGTPTRDIRLEWVTID